MTHILGLKKFITDLNEQIRQCSLTVTIIIRQEKEIKGRLEGEKENLPLFSV